MDKWCRPIAGVLALVGALWAASGCADDQTESTGPLALYLGEPNGDDDLVDGILVLEDGCLYVDSQVTPSRLVRYFVIFPAGTRWDEAKQAVLRKRAEPARVGTRVRVGGSEAASPASRWKAPPASGCNLENVWVGSDD